MMRTRNAVLLILLPILTLLPARGAEDEPLFTFRKSPDGTAVVRVDPSRAGQPISRRLFGKFTEHLHRNIYHGMWAQVVRNPGFEAWKFFFSDDEAMERARKRAAAEGRAWPEGLAAHWGAEGTGEVEYSLASDCVSSRSSQRVSIRSLETPAVGLRQESIYLPLHRESDYDVSVWVRSSEIDEAIIGVREGERSLATTTVGPLGSDWRRYERRLRISAKTELGVPLTLVLTAGKPGDLWLDQLLVFPADNVHGFDRDVVELCRKARLSLLRYPGGNFASGYHWRDGIGPVDRRPVRRNPAWHCPEYNHVGTDEFAAFCEAVGCEPMICVNAGNGTAEEAARWVEYCNGPVESRFGALRARHGHPRPYGVRYWEIGNELYGSWQVGHCSAQEYARRYGRFVEAMRKVDPEILFIANGHDASWHAAVLEAHGAGVRSFALHPLVGGGIPRDADPVATYRSLLAYPTWYRGLLERLGGQMARAGAQPRLAVTELQIFTNKPELPTNSTLSEAVYMARYFHTAIRLGSLVEMITHSALVNHGGGLRKQRGVVYAQPSWWATHLYGTAEGTVPLAVDIRTPVYSSSMPSMPSVDDAPYIDAVALTDTRRSVLTLLLVNSHPGETIETRIDVGDWPVAKKLQRRRLTGPSFLARNTVEARDGVAIEELEIDANVENGFLNQRLPACSITELVLRR